jgi:hypothetical protein
MGAGLLIVISLRDAGGPAADAWLKGANRCRERGGSSEFFALERRAQHFVPFSTLRVKTEADSLRE